LQPRCTVHRVAGIRCCGTRQHSHRFAMGSSICPLQDTKLFNKAFFAGFNCWEARRSIRQSLCLWTDRIPALVRRCPCGRASSSQSSCTVPDELATADRRRD
jgi:hypothetical protein